MVTHKLVPYKIRIWEVHERGHEIHEDEYFDLTSFPSSMPWASPYSSFLELIEESLEEIHVNPYINEDSERTLTAIDWDSNFSDNEIEAVLSKGNYGDPGDHLDVIEVQEPGNTVEDVRDTNALDENTALEKRYHFLFKVTTSSSRRGIVILQARGNGSVKSDLRKIIEAKLLDINENIRFEMVPIAGGDLYDELMDNPIKGFEVLETQVDADEYLQESDELGSQPTKNRVTINLSATGEDQFQFSRGDIREMIDNKEVPLIEFPEVDGDQGTSSHKVEIEKNGRPRKLNISKDQPKMEQEINTDIDYTNGRPDMVSVGIQSRRFASEVLHEQGWGTIDTNNTLISNTRFG